MKIFQLTIYPKSGPKEIVYEFMDEPKSEGPMDGIVTLKGLRVAVVPSVNFRPTHYNIAKLGEQRVQIVVANVISWGGELVEYREAPE